MVNAGFEIRNASADDAEMIQKITHEAFSSYVKLANIDGSIAALDESLDDIKKDIGEKISACRIYQRRGCGKRPRCQNR